MNRQVWIQIIAPQHSSCDDSFPAVTPLPLEAHLVFTPPTVLNFGKLGTLLPLRGTPQALYALITVVGWWEVQFWPLSQEKEFARGYWERCFSVFLGHVMCGWCCCSHFAP